MKTKDIIASIENTRTRSAWSNAVKTYALELLSDLESDSLTLETLPDLKNGARTWLEYSEGGCALIYDEDIARRLCTPSELKRTRNGERAPNSRESWLECQARALSHAETIIKRTLRSMTRRLAA